MLRLVSVESGQASDFLATNATTAGAPLSGSPMTAGSQPFSVAVDPLGRYAYVANQASNNISEYTIGAGGALTPLAGSPLPAVFLPASVTVDPSGRYVYVANRTTANISAYTIGADGALTAQVTYNVGDAPYSVTVGPSGRFVYVANHVGVGGRGHNTIAAFAIGAGGVLSPITTGGAGSCGRTPDLGNCFATGAIPASVTVGPSGVFLYVANEGGNDVSVYTIDASSGAPTPVTVGATACAGSIPGTNPNNCFAAGEVPKSIAISP